MLEESGVVESVDGEHAWVVAKRQSSCGSCSVKSGCSSGLLSEILPSKPQRFLTINALGARAGDHVIMQIDGGALVQAAIIVYALPLLSMLICALIFEGISAVRPEAWALVGAATGFTLGLVVAKWLGSRMRNRALPVITRKYLPVSA